MSQLERTFDKERTWNAWAGDLSELARIASTVVALGTAPREQELKDLRLRQQEQLEQYVRTDRSDLSEEQRQQRAERYYASNHQRELREIEDRWRAVTSLQSGDEKVTGAADEILKELDRRSVEEVSFSTGGGILDSQRVRVRLTRREGAMVEVHSKDPAWGRQSFAAVADEVEKGAQWWGSVYTDKGETRLRQLTTVAIFVTLVLLVRPWNSHLSAGNTIGVYLTLLFAAAFAALFSTADPRLRSWLFPKLEVLAEGTKPSGAARLGIVATWGATIVVGIAINILV